MKHKVISHIPLLKCGRYIVAMSLVGCAVVFAANIWRSSALKVNGKDAKTRQFHARVRDGIGSNVILPMRGDSSGEVRAAVNSVASFIEQRSGVNLDGTTKHRLSEMEERILTGSARPITSSELSNAITEVARERLSTLSDQDIARVDDTLRGFTAPNIPKKFNRDFKLPGGTVFMSTPAEITIARLKDVRDQLGTPAGDFFQGMAHKIIKERVQERARYLSEAVPEKFGSMWDTDNDTDKNITEGGITPLQAVLITYSLASDDYLSDSEVSLGKRMKNLQAALTETGGEVYPNPTGHRAFGVNGYLFSSPIDLMLDEQTINHLLDRIERRRAE